MAGIDPITLAVLAGRMEQIADEMDATLFRAAFNPIILRCLAKQPEQRFQRASELVQVLVALARSARIVARSTRSGFATARSIEIACPPRRRREALGPDPAREVGRID